MISLSKFNSSDDPEFHSHAIAKADDTQAKTMGSIDSTTFSQRKSVEQNRQIVAGYQAAGLIETYRQEARFHPPTSPPPHHRQRVTSTPRGTAHYRSARPMQTPPPRATKPEANSQPQPKAAFSEPQTRRYNPYG